MNANLDKLLASMHRQINVTTATATDRTLVGSQRDVAVDTGELKGSGYSVTVDLSGMVAYGTNHNWFVELGTSRMRAQPYLLPNFLGAGALWQRDLHAMSLY